MEQLQELLWLFSLPFMQRALIVGALVSISCSLLGLFLVLKRFALIGDGLAHVSFAAVALGILLGTTSLWPTFFVVLLGSLLMVALSSRIQLYGDTAIGLVSSATLALGIIIISVSKGLGVDIMSYLFGSILLISKDDVWLSCLLCGLVILCVVFFYHEIFHVSYDEDFAALLGINPRRINQLMIGLSAITVAIGIRVVGTMLISSLIVFPTISALQFKRGYKATLLISVLASLIALAFGLIASVSFEIPTGAAIVCAHLIVFACSYALRLIREGV